jgi:CHAT domain-containing protein
MKQLRSLYCKLQSEGSTNKEVMSRYKTQADSLDKILVNKLGEYAVFKRKFEITWQDVQSNLESSDAAIEFARYYDIKDSTFKYMALVVRPDYEYPKLVKIGIESEIKESIQLKDFSTLYNLVWQGIDSLLDCANRVYYSPAGELNNLSFASLYQRESGSDSISYLIDRYELHQLTTTRYLADGTFTKQKPFEASAVLIGGVDFNQTPSFEFKTIKEESNEDYLLQLNIDKEIQQNRSSSFSSKMPPLAGTEIEVKTVSGILRQSGWMATSYSGQNAGENQIKYNLLQKSPGVLHIATHGFAFPDIKKKESVMPQMNEQTSYKASEDPMVRCGLMLSGSNISWSGEPKKMIEQTGDDGILTAAEVANMDLSNTKLVVLSACETGLGKIEGSEGTFGLKRAFKLAGVEQLIVSLWSVPDEETMELMTLFYSDLVKTNDPVVSFSAAQKTMRYEYPNEPEKWAGFVLVR